MNLIPNEATEAQVTAGVAGPGAYISPRRLAGAVGPVEQALQAHIDDPTAAHAASAISFAPGGGIGSTTTQGAIAEVFTSIGTATAELVTGPASATDNSVVRFNGTTGKVVQQGYSAGRSVTISDTGTLQITESTFNDFTQVTTNSILVGRGNVGANLTRSYLNFANDTNLQQLYPSTTLGAETRINRLPATAGILANNNDLAAYQPLDSDLTDYANATDAAARRDLIGATAGVFPGAVVASATTSAAGVVPGLGGTTTTNAATVLQAMRIRCIPCAVAIGTANNSGTGAQSLNVNDARRLLTGATAGGFAQIRYRSLFPGIVGSGGRGPFSRTCAISFLFQLASGSIESDVRKRFLWGKTTATLSGQLSTSGFGFEVRGDGTSTRQLYAVRHNGITLSEDLIGTFVPITVIDLMAVSRVGTVDFYANGVLLASLTGGPTADTTTDTEITAEILTSTTNVSRLMDLINVNIFTP